MRIRTAAFGFVVAATVPLLSAASAGAADAGAVSVTEHFNNEVLFSDPSVNPCTGAPGTVTGTAKNGVMHITTLANGTSHGTFTAQGTITFVPDNPADASASGHFAVWDGFNVNQQNQAGTSTFNAVLSGSDGSRVGVHEVFHISTSASGANIEFDKPHMTCG
jgi:hypothetical protein